MHPLRMMEKWGASKPYRAASMILLGGLLVRTAIALWLFPGFDETYYYLYAINLDWSYFDHPVLVALTTGFGTWITGDVSQFTIRLGSLLLYLGSLGFLYRAGTRLFSEPAAVLTLAIASLVPIFQVGFGVLTLPDSPLMFFWAAALYLGAVEFFGEPGAYRPSYRLAVISLLVGLACLGKYHGFILGGGLLGFCLTSPPHRRALASPWTALGLILFGLSLFPVLFWNAQHDWISFRFQSARGVPDGGYRPLEVLGTFLAGVGYLFPTIGFPLWWVSLKTLWQQWMPDPSHLSAGVDLRLKQRFILWLSLPLILGFALMAGYTQVLPTWQMPGFWTATLLLGQWAETWQARSPRQVRRWLVGTGVATIVALAVALLHVATGTLQKPSQYAIFGGFIPPEQDPSTQLVDIQQLRRGFAESPQLRDALRDASFVFTNRYYLAGQVGMALVPLYPRPITCFDDDLRGMAFWSHPDEWLGQDGLYITTREFQRRNSLLASYRTYFESLEEIGTVPIRRGGAITEVFSIYRGKRLLKPYPRPYGDEMFLD